MAERRHDPRMIRFMAEELERAADEVDRSGTTMPEQIDASVLGPPISNQFEAVAANLAALVSGLDMAAAQMRVAARRYEAGEEVNVQDLLWLFGGGDDFSMDAGR